MSFSNAEWASLSSALRLRRESERDIERSLPAAELLDADTLSLIHI